MRRRGGATTNEPDPDYWDFDGSYSVGHSTGTFLMYDMTDDEITEYQAEQKAREEKRVPPGFQVPSASPDLH